MCKINLAINATNIGPQGGVTVIAAYLKCWLETDLDISVFVTDCFIQKALQSAHPSCKIYLLSVKNNGVTISSFR